ncbi:MAG TPA: CPBP family intramembrane glutamic endopeptidase [Candidatus Polarisedimenticolaceae bacterium]|nr:CPBP family intramembrane glutamic endopeptidase [Candidatus Polarisedimenticolaceae bacterium]
MSSRRSDVILLVVALAASAIFTSQLHLLWPLARMDLNVPAARLERDARTFLTSRRFDLRGYRAAAVLNVDDGALDYAERTFGRARAQDWIERGLPLAYYRVDFKKEGVERTYSVELHPARGVIGWRTTVEEDAPGPRPTLAQAEGAAERALRRVMHLDPEAWTATAATAAERPHRRDHAFTFEQPLSRDPDFGQYVRVTVAGEEVLSVTWRLVVPSPAARAARAQEAPGIALETCGFILAGVAAVGAFFVFLAGLRDGRARFDRPATWVGMLFVCLIGTQLLQESNLILQWEPLLPWWVFLVRSLVDFAVSGVWNLLLLLAVIAAGDALDQGLGAGKGDALWALSRGHLTEPRVGAASARGFLLGLICGAVMVLAVATLEALVGIQVDVQPRGFFFYALNAAFPSASTLLFFGYVALAEELSYRYFGGLWLRSALRSRWLAVAIPALIYGLTHTRLDFLPPAEPFWGRAAVMTLVGCVWGWAFFRYDALTVVLSHLSADLFIFNWPRLTSADPATVTSAAVTIAAPLLPAVLAGAAWAFRRLRPRALPGTTLEG